MFDDLSDYVLRLRRARVCEAALALANRATRQHSRPFNTREQAQYDELTAALNRLDNRLRQLRLESRRADGPSADEASRWDPRPRLRGVALATSGTTRGRAGRRVGGGRGRDRS